MSEDTKLLGSRIRTALESLVRNGEVICDEGPRGSKTYYLKPKPTPEGMF
jgi:hypothetical protein